MKILFILCVYIMKLSNTKSSNTRWRSRIQKRKRTTMKRRNKHVRMFYCGIRLDAASKTLLVDTLKRLGDKVPQFDHTKCDHITIGFNRRLLSSEPRKGTKVQFTTNQYGFNDKAIAVRIDDDHIVDIKDGNQVILGQHNTLHITLATLKKNGSRESNNITRWTTMDNITLTGTIGEFDSVKRWNITNQKNLNTI